MSKYYKTIDLRVSNDENLESKYIYDSNKDIRIIYSVISISGILIILYLLGVLYLIENSINLVPENHKYIMVAIISILYFLILIFKGKILFEHLVFRYKGKFMNNFYRIHNKDNFNLSDLPFDDVEWSEYLEADKFLIPTSRNGEIIGILESLLFAIGILMNSVLFIGTVLAIRSYVAVTSQNNKEESEFYIIGVLTSLISTIIVTIVFSTTFHLIYGEKLYQVISKFL